MAEEKKDISVLLDEKRVFEPPQELVEKANVKQWMDAHGIKDLDELLEKSQDIEWFWKEMATELLEFYEPYEKVLEWDAELLDPDMASHSPVELPAPGVHDIHARLSVMV